MSRLADRRDFGDAIAAAASALRMPAAIIEKDYWVTQALRAISATHPEDWIFKGGTSLSKGYDLIRRFSEDIDVLVLRRDRGETVRDRVMKEMAASAASALGISELPPPASAARGIHRSYELPYPQLTEPSADLRPRVLLEMGIRGGPAPNEHRDIGALISLAGVLEPADYEDLATFPVPVLHPGRTLVEKLLLVHETATKLDAGELREVPAAFGRHLYDIYELLGSEVVAAFLSDRDEFQRVCDDAFDIGSEYFEASARRPEEGFAASPAFDGAQGGSVALAMTRALDVAQSLAFADSTWPTYPELRVRVQEMAERL